MTRGRDEELEVASSPPSPSPSSFWWPRATALALSSLSVGWVVREDRRPSPCSRGGGGDIPEI